MCFEIKLDGLLSLYVRAMNIVKQQKSRFSIACNLSWIESNRTEPNAKFQKLGRIDSNSNRTFSIRSGLCYLPIWRRLLASKGRAVIMDGSSCCWTPVIRTRKTTLWPIEIGWAVAIWTRKLQVRCWQRAWHWNKSVLPFREYFSEVLIERK
jgi:hypothetical protein